jgi:hypothetical protein
MAIASFFLGTQHMFFPFIFDGRFIILATGNVSALRLVLKLCPTLLPYFMILQALLDISAVTVYLTI